MKRVCKISTPGEMIKMNELHTTPLRTNNFNRTKSYLFSLVKIFNILFVACLMMFSCTESVEKKLNIYPSDKAEEISPDTHLKITFGNIPTIGKSGKIRIYDYETDILIDSLDMSIPAGPTKSQRNPDATYTKVPYKYVSGNFTNANTKPGTPSGTAQPNSDKYQLSIIGGFTDGFHFYPVIVHDSTAIITLHNNLLEYNKRYYVLIDSTVLNVDGGFNGIYHKNAWTFSTRKTKPNLSSKKLVVDDKGNGDFNTLQGALDYIPDYYDDTITIFIRNGVYDELIYFRNKTNIAIEGESRNGVVLQYANNEVFNPHPWSVKTNEWPGTFPSRRSPFAVDNCSNIQLQNFTVKNLLKGQAEGLLINGNKIFVKDLFIIGDGDALQTNGIAYFENVKIDGGGDMILGRGAAFFKNCDFYSPGPFMWVRNTDANHGNIFVNCKFHGSYLGGSELARAPINGGRSYPYCEAVLINCSLDNIVPQGWGEVGGDTKNIHYWEFNSTEIPNGNPIDISQRKKYSRQLKMPYDKIIIEKYSSPAFVLEGWHPETF